MKFVHLTLLSASVALLLTSCHERGKVIPISKKKSVKKNKVVKIYDFPVLKLSANTNQNHTQEKIFDKPKSTKELSKSLRFPKMTHQTTKKQNSETSMLLESKKNIKTLKHKPLLSLNKDKTLLQKVALQKVVKETKKLQINNRKNVFTKKKRGTKNKQHKSSSSGQIPIIGSLLKPNVSLQDIPIINKILPKPSAVSKGRIKSHSKHSTTHNTQSYRNTHISTSNRTTVDHNNEALSFSGGTSNSELDMAKIRVESDNYQTNIILDSYKWAGYNTMATEVSAVSGTYFFKYEPYNNRIIGIIKGYNSFSALVKKKDTLLQNNPVVKNIYLDRYIGDDGIRFHIELKQNVKVNIIDVEDPGSIIIELYPTKSD